MQNIHSSLNLIKKFPYGKKIVAWAYQFTLLRKCYRMLRAGFKLCLRLLDKMKKTEELQKCHDIDKYLKRIFAELEHRGRQ